MSADHISLTVPARAEYAKAVRMTAAALVSRLGMTYDEVDDVRIAAEEAFVYAVDHVPDSAEVTLEFAISDELFEIRVGLAPGSRVTDEDAERREQRTRPICVDGAESLEHALKEAVRVDQLSLLRCLGHWELRASIGFRRPARSAG